MLTRNLIRACTSTKRLCEITRTRTFCAASGNHKFPMVAKKYGLVQKGVPISKALWCETSSERDDLLKDFAESERKTMIMIDNPSMKEDSHLCYTVFKTDWSTTKTFIPSWAIKGGYT